LNPIEDIFKLLFDRYGPQYWWPADTPFEVIVGAILTQATNWRNVALIRLIQRAGRVDRIGQKSPNIICYSFLPQDGLERIINLRNRLAQRITENSEVVGSDEVFFDGDPVNIADRLMKKPVCWMMMREKWI